MRENVPYSMGAFRKAYGNFPPFLGSSWLTLFIILLNSLCGGTIDLITINHMFATVYEIHTVSPGATVQFCHHLTINHFGLGCSSRC